jgi:hypothetical protein
MRLPVVLSMGSWRRRMRSESALKVEVMKLLLNTFGVLETERFIAAVKNSNFDYTEWHKNLWKERSIEEIHKAATEFASPAPASGFYKD